MTQHDEEINEAEIDGGDSSELRVYELGFHIDPELPTEEVKKVYHAMRELVENNGTLVAEGEPEKIQLAYTISRQETSGRRDFDTAYFCWIVYETDALRHSEVVGAANANKRIIRFIDLITTKDSARHSVEMHELSLKTTERAKDSETAINEELDTALENAAV
jgi:ribosomal protein S6